MYEYNPYKYRKSALKINMDDKISKKKKEMYSYPNWLN